MTSLRWTLAMLLLAASCTRTPTTEPVAPRTFRPADTASGKTVAVVLLSEGMPSIVAGTRTLTVAENLEVQDGDTLRVPARSWLVLRILGNGYVVKVDEDLELPVKDLALLKAPPTTESLQAQLERMVSAREIGADRVTAYQNRKVAGEGAKAEENVRRKGMDSVGPAAPSPAPAAASAAPQAEPPPPPPAEAQVEAKSDRALLVPPGRAGGGGGPSRKAAAVEKKSAATDDVLKEADAKEFPPAAAKPAEVAWEIVQGGYAKPGTGPLPAEIAAALNLQDAKRCLQSAWAAKGLATAGAVDQLLLRVEKGQVVKVKLSSGVPVSACAAAAVGKAAGLEGDGWIRIPIALD
ncbi:MAG: hypothetical protein QM765_46245 [Myxococcales bacterium]